VVGFVIAILRTTHSRALRLLTAGYIQLFQGTPVLMQLFLFYYGLAVLYDLQVDAWPAVALAFTLYAGAFLGEIWRGSIQAIPRTQWEASACLSLSYIEQLRFVILPQAMRISIPPTVGFLVQLVKGTSIAAIIVSYFTAAPLMKTLMKLDPLSTERIRERRAFVLDFISAALFT